MIAGKEKESMKHTFHPSAPLNAKGEKREERIFRWLSIPLWYPRSAPTSCHSWRFVGRAPALRAGSSFSGESSKERKESPIVFCNFYQALRGRGIVHLSFSQGLMLSHLKSGFKVFMVKEVVFPKDPRTTVTERREAVEKRSDHAYPTNCPSSELLVPSSGWLVKWIFHSRFQSRDWSQEERDRESFFESSGTGWWIGYTL